MSSISIAQKPDSGFQETGTSLATIMPITVLVVDDHALVRAAIKDVLTSQPEIKCVAMVRNYIEAEKETVRLHPDIIWLDMDITHSSNTGIVEINRLRKLSPGSRIIALADVEDENEAFAAIMTGAQGYRSKQDIDPSEVMPLIRMMCSGETALQPALMTQVMHRLRVAAMPLWGAENIAGERVLLRHGACSGVEQLTIREREVLQFISRGYRDRDIAKGLHISEKTVQKHVQNVLGKLGVRSRTEAAYLIHQQEIL
ncbi:MAG: response regulator transcription factor [Ktedonobacteraceae bacterium]